MCIKIPTSNTWQLISRMSCHEWILHEMSRSDFLSFFVIFLLDIIDSSFLGSKSSFKILILRLCLFRWLIHCTDEVQTNQTGLNSPHILLFGDFPVHFTRAWMWCTCRNQLFIIVMQDHVQMRNSLIGYQSTWCFSGSTGTRLTQLQTAGLISSVVDINIILTQAH